MFAFPKAEGGLSEREGFTPHFIARRDFFFNFQLYFIPLFTLVEK